MSNLREAVEAMLAERYGLGRTPPPQPAPTSSSAAIIRRIAVARALDDRPCRHVMPDGQHCALLVGHEADGLTDHDPEP